MNNPNDELIAVRSRAKRRFPDHNVNSVAFRVCLPVYELRLKVTELGEDSLSTAARFVLQLSNLDVTQPAEFGRLLGISDSYVTGATAELLASNLVVQRPDLGIEITDPGKEVLHNGGRSMRPRNRYPKVPYDPLTKRIIDVDVDLLLDRDIVRKNGFFVPSTSPRRPRLSSLRIDAIREYLRFYGSRQDKTEILDVSDIRDVKLRYRDDVIVVKLDSPNSTKPTFAAYHAQQYLEDESAAIQRLADRGVDLVPDEVKVDRSTPWTNSLSISSAESTLLATIDEIDNAVGEADRASTEAKAVQGTTQDAQERADLASQIEGLEAEKLDLMKVLAEKESELETLTKGETRLIKTEEHRHVLLEAIARASSELTLVSAWIDPYTFDDHVCRLLADAIERGAVVRIAWGFGTNRGRGSESNRNREKGETALRGLRRLLPKHLATRLEEKRTETHEKFIICDDLFCAWGSFNWLSYRGQRDAGYRRETSYYSERKDDIALWKANAAPLFRVS